MRYYYFILLLLAVSCKHEPVPVYHAPIDTTVSCSTDTIPISIPITTAKDSVSPAEIVTFAKTLLGTPYKFGCTAPSTGFDCSGFIGYVFHHFNIDVPRSSVDFTNEGTTIPLAQAQPGDLILFTGTNSKIRTVGHIGLVISNDSSGISFIHSSSGSENAVIITPLNERYMERFVKVVRIGK